MTPAELRPAVRTSQQLDTTATTSRASPRVTGTAGKRLRAQQQCRRVFPAPPRSPMPAVKLRALTVRHRGNKSISLSFDRDSSRKHAGKLTLLDRYIIAPAHLLQANVPHL